MFRELVYKKSIVEDVLFGIIVLIVFVVDDLGMNVVKIIYKFKFGNLENFFWIGFWSGIIEVNDFGLDYELEKNYLMGVEVWDESINKSVVVEVNIIIIDVNDNLLVFDLMEYVKEVYENVLIGMIFVWVNVMDKDFGVK